MADPERSSSPFINVLDADDAHSFAMMFCILSVSSKYLRTLKAKTVATRCN